MSIMSSRSMLIATGVAVCAVAAAVQPVRSWALHGNVAHAAVQQVDRTAQPRPGRDRGQYPDVDIQIIEDYSPTRGSGSMVRIHMDLTGRTGADFTNLKNLLADSKSTADQVSDELKKVVVGYPTSDKGKRGYKVLRAAIGYTTP